VNGGRGSRYGIRGERLGEGATWRGGDLVSGRTDDLARERLGEGVEKSAFISEICGRKLRGLVVGDEWPKKSVVICGNLW